MTSDRATTSRTGSVDTSCRCSWARTPLSIEYHDAEWGVPVHDDRVLFELLLLEGAQAGLSWETILKRRDGYRRCFADFDPVAVAAFDEDRIEDILQDPGVVRHRLKVESAVTNARAFLDVQEEFGSFDAYLWEFVGGSPKVNRWKALDEVPARTPVSGSLSKDLQERGFRFVGPTICYAYMQAVGMVNDHMVSCFRYGEVGG